MDPSVMFADEPTSGLDSFMAESVVRQLHTLAQGGRCIIASIHQPSTDVNQLFSKVRVCVCFPCVCACVYSDCVCVCPPPRSCC